MPDGTDVSAHRPVAVVSGGSSGIGNDFVTALHARGYRVFACGRDPERLRRLERDHPGVRGLACDLADPGAVQNFMAAVLGASPRIDLLVSNAGVLRTLDFADPAIGAADPELEIGINLGGAIRLIAAAMPGLLAAAPSRIVVVGSGYGLASWTAAPVYSASKAGLHGFCKALRRQLAASRIGVTEVLPPLVDTPAVSHRHGAKLSPDALVRQVLRDASRSTWAATRCSPAPSAGCPCCCAWRPGSRSAWSDGAEGSGGHGWAGTCSAMAASSVSRPHPTRPTITSSRNRRPTKSCASRSPSISTRSNDAAWPCTSIRLP